MKENYDWRDSFFIFESETMQNYVDFCLYITPPPKKKKSQIAMNRGLIVETKCTELKFYDLKINNGHLLW